MTRPLKETALRIAILLVGLTIAHLGVTLFLLADLGADPFNVFIQGLHKSQLFGLTSSESLTHGIVHLSVSCFIVAILLICTKGYIKIGTLLCMLLGGPIIDIFSLLLNPLFNAGSPFALRIAMLAVGCAILAYGMTIVIKSDSGTGPNDLVAVVISDKLRKPFGITRIVVDVLFVAAGYCGGGIVGIGTIICAALVGPVAGYFLPINGRIIERIVRRK